MYFAAFTPLMGLIGNKLDAGLKSVSINEQKAVSTISVQSTRISYRECC